MLFCIIYINYNHKLLAEVEKPEISQNKFKKLSLKKGLKITQKKKKGKNELLVYICFKTRKSVEMLIINSRICF